MPDFVEGLAHVQQYDGRSRSPVGGARQLRNHADELRAVSYTHLDVYKRQVFERLLLARIWPMLDNFIRSEQFEFRREHSTCLLYTSRCV